MFLHVSTVSLNYTRVMYTVTLLNCKFGSTATKGTVAAEFITDIGEEYTMHHLIPCHCAITTFLQKCFIALLLEELNFMFSTFTLPIGGSQMSLSQKHQLSVKQAQTSLALIRLAKQ